MQIFTYAKLPTNAHVYTGCYGNNRQYCYEWWNGPRQLKDYYLYNLCPKLNSSRDEKQESSLQLDGDTGD